MTRLLSTDQIDILRKSIYPAAPPDQIELLVATSNRSGLDPFARQIYMIERRFKDRDGNWQSKWEIQTSIDGFRVIAERTGLYQGQDGPFWCGEDGKWTDVWLKSTPPKAAKVGILKKGFTQPLYSVAKWESYAQTNRQGQLSPMWVKMPDLMLGKCAESLALRRAFPNDLSGLYTAEEMAQAENHSQSHQPSIPTAKAPPSRVDQIFELTDESRTTVADLPPPSEGPSLDDYLKDPPSETDGLDFESEMANQSEITMDDEVDAYRIPFGKYTGKSLKQLGVHNTMKYLDWLEDAAKARGEKLSNAADTFRIMAIRFQQREMGR